MGEEWRVLSEFSLTQLSSLLEDEQELLTMVTQMEEMQQVQQSKEMTLASNRSLAEQNLSLQPGLDQQRLHLTKRYCCLQELYEAYQLRKSTLDYSSGNSSLDTLLALLQAEGAKIEEETENLADSFLDGDLSLDPFIEEYQSKRKLAHLRRVKIDKLREMLLKRFQYPQPCVNQFSNLQTNGSPLPERPSAVPNMVPSYSGPLLPHHTPALNQKPGSGQPPRTGFIVE